MKGPIELLIFQGTPFCNINCSYCYLPDRTNKAKMAFNIISKTMDRIHEADIINTRFTVVWHAGEPLVLPIEYYEEAFEIIKKKTPPNVEIEQNFQTNATLITQRWCDFFKKHKTSLGVSIDGPEFIHDMYRVHRNGKGTFNETMKGIHLLKANNIPIRVIAVLTKQSALFPNLIYDFFLELGIEFIGFNIDEIEAENTKSTYANDDESKSIVEKFFEYFLERQIKEGESFKVRELDEAKNRIATSPIKNLAEILTHTQLSTPFKILTVTANGDFSTFDPELANARKIEKYGTMLFGNVFTNSLDDIMKTSKFITVMNDIDKGIKMCQENCDFFGLCPGGFPSNKLHEKGTFAADETMYCNLHKKVPLRVVLNQVEKEIYSI